MPVFGFQRHSYMCPSCHDTEQRLAFDKHSQALETETGFAPASLSASMIRKLCAIANDFLRLLARMPRAWVTDFALKLHAQLTSSALLASAASRHPIRVGGD
jgi:hypothetical protein